MKRIIMLALLFAAAAVASAQTFKVTSPDGRQEAIVDVKSSEGKTSIVYQTSFDGRQVVLPSVLDLTFDNHICTSR